MDPSVYKAATSGTDADFLQRITDGNVSSVLLHQQTPGGNNILHLAAKFEQIKIFKQVRLSLRPRMLWAVNKKGDTPLHCAARVGCDELVDFLIEQAKLRHVRTTGGLDHGPTYADSYKKLLRMTNSEMHTALHVAARYGHHGVVTSLMKADPGLCSSTISHEESPLFLATCKGFLNIARHILKEASPPVSFKGINGVTALHAAVTHTYQGAEEIVEIMVSKYPDIIKEADALGWTPLHYAAWRGNLRATQLLMEYDKSSTCYVQDNFGMSPLHVAAYKGHIDVMTELIQCRPDICEILNAKNQTILNVAVLGAQSNIIEHILKIPELRRLIDQADIEGNTPLHLAVTAQNYEVTEILLRLVDTATIDTCFSLLFDNFPGEQNNIQTASALTNREKEDTNLPHYDEAEQDGEVRRSAILVKGFNKLKITDSSHRGCSFGVPLFQEQIRLDFMKFQLHLDGNEDSTTTWAVADKNDAKLNTELLVATLILTVTFTAILSPPGGFGDNGKMVLQDNKYFRWFQEFNWVSFGFAILVIVNDFTVAIWGTKLLPIKSETLVLFSMSGLIGAVAMGANAARTTPRKAISADPWIRSASVAFALAGTIPAYLLPLVKRELTRRDTQMARRVKKTWLWRRLMGA